MSEEDGHDKLRGKEFNRYISDHRMGLTSSNELRTNAAIESRMVNFMGIYIAVH